MTYPPFNVVLCVLAVTFIGTEFTKLTFQNLDLIEENHYLHRRVDKIERMEKVLELTREENEVLGRENQFFQERVHHLEMVQTTLELSRMEECEDASDYNTKEWSEHPRADWREESSGVSTAHTAPPSTAVALVTQPNAGATPDEPRFHTEYCVVTEVSLSNGEAACLLACGCVFTFLYGLSVLENTHLQAENLRLVRLHEDLQDESHLLRDENVTLSTKNLKLQILLVLQTVTLVGVITAWMASSFIPK